MLSRDLKHFLKNNLPGNNVTQIVGIDPGATTGFAFYDLQSEEWAIRSSNIQDCYNVLWDFGLPKPSFFVMEYNAELQTVYNKRAKTNVAQQRKISFNAGMNAGLCNGILAYLLNKFGKEYVRIDIPSEKKRRKWDAKICKAVTNYEGQTNEHTRDAMRLVMDVLHPWNQSQGLGAELANKKTKR